MSTRSAEDASVVDLHAVEDEAVIGRLLSGAVERLRSLGAATVNLNAGDGHPWKNLFQRAGFSPRESSPLVLAIAAGVTVSPAEFQKNWVTQTQLIEDRVRDFVLQHFPLARKSGVKPQDKWLETGLLDSLGILDLVHFVETEFAIHVSDEDLSPENFQSLAAVAAFIESRQAGKA